MNKVNVLERSVKITAALINNFVVFKSRTLGFKPISCVFSNFLKSLWVAVKSQEVIFLKDLFTKYLHEVNLNAIKYWCDQMLIA